MRVKKGDVGTQNPLRVSNVSGFKACAIFVFDSNKICTQCYDIVSAAFFHA